MMTKRTVILAVVIIAAVMLWMRPEKGAGRNADAGSFILTAHAQTANYGGVSITSYATNCVPVAPTAASLSCSAITDSGTKVSFSYTGTNSAPGISLINVANTGIYNSGGHICFTQTGTGTACFSGSNFSIPSTGTFSFSSNSNPDGQDTLIGRDAAGFISIKGASNAIAGVRIFGGNGGYVEYGTAQELLTLSTSGTTTDTTATLLPANSYIDAVDAIVTTTITTATSWQLGDPTTPGRFSAVNAVMTSGSTQVGTVQADQTGASGPRQVAAAKVRVTTVGTPGAGAIRIMVHYHSFTPPTS